MTADLELPPADAAPQVPPPAETAIAAAARIVGSQSALARALPKDEAGKAVSSQAVSQWISSGRCPVGRVVAVEAAVAAAVKASPSALQPGEVAPDRYSLRPDTYGARPAGKRRTGG